MKRYFIFTLLAISMLLASAQGQRIFLFENFDEASIYMKNKSITKSPMNYDANNGKVYYMQGEDLMELTNLAQIDSIRFGERLFLVKGLDIVENVATPEGDVQILWRIHKVHDGYVGAYGTSQVPSRKIQLQGNFGLGGLAGAGGGMYNGSFGVNDSAEGGRNLDVWRTKTANTYYFDIDGTKYEIKQLKQLYKAFPEKKNELKAYAKENHLDFSTAEKALQLITALRSL